MLSSRESSNPSGAVVASTPHIGYIYDTMKSFCNRNWQELESTASNQTTVNIWGLRYIDDLILREQGAERLYSLADPNWNVVATTNASGTVQERMRYDAFGRITWLNASFATKANTDFAWNRTFTGQVFDSESGLMLYHNRYYHTGLGRFVSRDPIGYNAGDVSFYRYLLNSSCNSTDAHGLQARRLIPCERMLLSAQRRIESNRRFGHDILRKCNIDIRCHEDCWTSQSFGAVAWASDEHVHICFRESTIARMSQREVTTLLIHELVHADQFIQENECLCNDKKFDGDPPPSLFLTEEELVSMEPVERDERLSDCERRERQASEEQIKALRNFRNAPDNLVQACTDRSCNYQAQVK